MSQCERLLARLKLGPVTQLEAMNELGILNAAGRVYDLRRRGHDIASIKEEVTNRFGEVSKIVRYALIAANDEVAK